ncbi:Bromo adjacent homology (BAH) domain [Macleaya cordata]|uniref:Bromo adjacent homology (BAH) domain n=1 Tax=Macleaya cordata TaxID=56857 RepID=A0A200QI21_MACCD|nr:Bromo adjacent homology (BAH) domain [Macleaya cordata]
MDSVGFDSVDPSGMGSENLVSLVGDKRVGECNDGENLGVKKKARVDSSGDMKRIAEIVLVLSAMGKMRGGRNPTDVEKGLMAEAREKLTAICEAVSPQDIIPRDAVRVVIEDLGLNKSRDQRLGFRPPKMSIAEKFLLAKRKMEESKKFAAQSTTYSPQVLQTGYGAKAESNRTLLHTANKSPPEKPTPAALSVGGFQAVSPIVHVSALASTSNQSPVNEVQSATVSRGLLGPATEINSSSLQLPRMEGGTFRSDGRLNGSIYASHVQANSSGDHLPEKAPMFSPQSVVVAKVGQANKAPDHSSKVEGTPEVSTSKVALQMTRDQISKPSVIQTAHGNLTVHQPSQATNYLQPSSVFSNHSDIAKNVQKLLQPRLPEHPNWTPPSTDYMNKSLTCQICKVTINDVESLLVCDACEKGVHLKCLQSYNQKGIPKGEWHCPQCLVSSNGKPLPPKYGRVTRNITTQKVSPNIGRVQAPPGKVESPDQKVLPQKVTANGNSGGQNLAHAGSTGSNHSANGNAGGQNLAHAGSTGSNHSANGNAGGQNLAHAGSTGRNHSGSASDLKMSNAREGLEANFPSSRKKMEEEPPSEMRSVPKETAGVCAPPCSSKPNDSSIQHLQNSESSPCQPQGSISEIKSPQKVQIGDSCPDKPSSTSSDTCNNSQATCNSQDVDKAAQPSYTNVSADQSHEVKISDLRGTFERNLGCDVRQDDQDVAQTISVGTSDVGNGARNCTRSSLDGLHNVDWVGDILQVVDEKAFYKSCHINGIVYKLQDHALFRSNGDNLRPSKLQALWEDTKTGSKWAIVNRCYLPDDLPEVVGRPCTPENNEVYESNHGSTVRASLIQGSCEVLSPNKFKEECERRTRLEHETNDGLQPVFLCKYAS